MLPAGTVVGAYRVESLLGRGGMGTVFRARHTESDRVVALKLLGDQVRDDPEFVARFRREGRAQASLEHPHVVTVYEAGDSEHGLYLAMRLVEGSTLAELIKARALGVRRALNVLGQVADALDAAHAAGLVHRDVKPHNVLIGSGDHAYLADFGLTRAGDTTTVTRTGLLLGTWAYMAPEVARGQPPAPPADRYAFAAVAFECLTGSVVFPRSTQNAVLFAHASEPAPRISGRRPELGEGLDDLFERALAKDPAERPAGSRELVDAVAAVLEREGTADLGPPAPAGSQALGASTTAEPVLAAIEPATVAARRSQRRPLLVAALAALAGAAATAAVWALSGSDGDTKAAAVPADPPGLTFLGSDLGTRGRTLDCAGKAPGRDSPECTVIQSELPGATLVVPETGAIRRWSVRSARGELTLVVLRPRGAGAGSFQVATSQTETAGSADVQSFPAEIAVDRGDLVGLRVAPGGALGVADAEGAATERWIPPLVGASRPADRPAGSGFDHELLLRVGYVPGGRPRLPRQITGGAAAALPAGSEVDRQRAMVGDREVEIALVEVDGRFALDLFSGDRRVARIDVPEMRKEGFLVEFDVDDSGEEDVGIGLEWINKNSARIIQHSYGADTRSFEIAR